ncbi:hypothetical protein [Methylobacterium planeticum]|uniref:Uncharacterized protein n=1 Tax=Methylobacterium planeticum TaxID=2615211 RepID=A0A6N6MX37_9HYPH|nr:hypothetical protein [Methylobacterium planeticum]KAB1075989.1 hypothetical protein F6X51_00120 [Methylobacterium planeticum]
MRSQHRRTAEIIDRAASTTGAILTNTLYLTACYVVALLVSQVMLFDRDGIWFGAACPLHAAMTGTGACAAYVSSVHTLGDAVRYVALEMNLLAALSGLILALFALKAVSEAIRTRLNPSEATLRGTAALSGV